VVRLFAAAALLAVFAGLALARGNKAGIFDYYVLSLSWSPSFCGTPAGNDNPTQCAPGRRFAFVVHGLWPQFKDGWPEFCATEEAWVPEQKIDAMMDIMPSRKLIIHEWRKHGSCSGLSQADYFGAIRVLRERLRIPARYLSPAAEIRTTRSADARISSFPRAPSPDPVRAQSFRTRFVHGRRRPNNSRACP
jgi:ribonuclease T2